MRTALHVFAAAFILTLVCACQPVSQNVAVTSTPATPAAPVQDPDVSWRRLDTINNCNVYLVRYKDRDFLLATSMHVRPDSSSSAVACALVPAS